MIYLKSIISKNIQKKAFYKFWIFLSKVSSYDLIKIDEYDHILKNYRCMNYLAVSKKIKFS